MMGIINNDWCVCSDRDGGLSLCSGFDREEFLNVCKALKEEVPTYVVRRFPTLKEAILYIEDIATVNKLIEEL